MTLRCQDCGGEGCAACGQMGRVDLPGCPFRHFEAAELADLVFAAGQADKGCWPEGGGWRDEPVALVEAIREVWRQQNLWKLQARREALSETD